MSAFDAFFSTWMTFAAVLVFLKVKKFITWDWGIVVAPAVVGFLVKGYLVLFSRS